MTYSFDANGRVEQGIWYTGSGTTQVENKQVWQYDSAGNVVDYRTYKDGVEDSYSSYKYFENNKQWYSNSDGAVTTNTFDLSGRLTHMKLEDGGSVYNYAYSYYADGRDQAVRANGDASGSSTFSYDANENKIRVDKGNGDGQKRNAYSTFMYDNENHIIYKYADDGDSTTYEKVEYAYANGNPVGETGNDVDGVHTTKLDTGNYSTIKNIGDEFPATSVTMYTVNPGDTLQSIASAMYGNPSLWFVIAEANGLNGTEKLTAGSKLQVPNSIGTGSLTSEAHALYQEGDIIGSSLPNLVSPPPPSDGCGSILMIIIVVVVAVVAAYFLGPAANGLAGWFGGAATATATAVGSLGLVAGIATYALAGALVYAVANIVQQGLFYAMRFQDSFEWGQVGDAAITGLFTGAAAGLATAGKVAETSTQLAKISVTSAKVAAAAVKVAGAAIGQYLKDGEITSWTSIAVAALGPSDTGDVDKAGKAIELAGVFSDTAINYVSPWLQLAETYVRNDGKVEPADWATAVTSTVSNAINNNAGDSNKLGYRLLNNTLVGGALSLYDSTAAESYFANAVGNEMGSLIGGAIVSDLRAAKVGSTWGRSETHSGKTGEVSQSAAERATDAEFAAIDAEFAALNSNGTMPYAVGPEPTTYASTGLGDGLMTDAGPQSGPIQVGGTAGGNPYTDEELLAATQFSSSNAENIDLPEDLSYALGSSGANSEQSLSDLLSDPELVSRLALNAGQESASVAVLQEALIREGYLPAGSDDWKWGPQTAGALAEYAIGNLTNQDTLNNLGAEEIYRPHLLEAQERSGIPASGVAGLINAETTQQSLSTSERYERADEVFYTRHPELNGKPLAADAPVELRAEYMSLYEDARSVWNPNPGSSGPLSSTAGMTQFTSGTWRHMALTPGTLLNEVASSRGYINSQGGITNDEALLTMRVEPRMAIVSAAEYAKQEFMANVDVIPTSVYDNTDSLARNLYVGHHEGATGAKQYYNQNMPETRASHLFDLNVLTKENGVYVPDTSRIESYRQDNNNSYSAGYRAWLSEYATDRIVTGRYQ